MEMEEIAMKTQKVEMKGSRNILEVKDIVRKSEKTKMEKEMNRTFLIEDAF